MGLAYDPDLRPEPAATENAATEEERNSNLLRHGAAVLCGRPVFGTVNPIRVERAQTPVPRRIGFVDIEQVATITEQLGQLARDLGGIPMTGALTVHTRVSEALLSADMREPVGSGCCSRCPMHTVPQAVLQQAPGCVNLPASISPGPWTAPEQGTTCGTRWRTWTAWDGSSWMPGSPMRP
jgi:hypothetical protein